MTKDTILSLLRQSPGEFVSGEVIRQAAGVSRAAVSKAVAVLRQEGHEIESVTNRGYRLISLADSLRPEELRQRLTGHHIGQEIVCLPTIDSTNNEIKRRAVSGSVDGLVILADQQTGGRGRRGRSFVSPAGKGLYLSAALKPHCPLERVSSLTAWTAVALCDAIEQVCGVRPGIKWPNDLVLQDKKLCGVLTEMELEAETGSLGYVIIGIGINLRQNEADFWPGGGPHRHFPSAGVGPRPGPDGTGRRRAAIAGQAVPGFPGAGTGVFGALPPGLPDAMPPCTGTVSWRHQRGHGGGHNGGLRPHRPLAGRNGGSRDLRGGLRPRAVRVRIRE